MDLSKEIKFLSGVGPKKADLLEKGANIRTFEDLLFYFPYKYIDRTQFYKISEISGDLPYIQVRGKFKGFRTEGLGKVSRYIGLFADETGTMEMVWFKGLKYIKDTFSTEKEYVIFGKPNEFKNRFNIVHPEVETAEKFDKNTLSNLQAAYNTTEKMKNGFLTSKAIHKLQIELWNFIQAQINETLPDYLIQKLKLLSLKESLFNIHFPQNANLLHKATLRLKFEELFYLQLIILKSKFNRNKAVEGFVFNKVGDFFNSFFQNHLPFELTNAQKKVIREIRKDLGTGKQMNRLLQGDVGSGKTLVALMVCLIALDNGFQACIMAPTEILANQHYETISTMISGLDIGCKLLTGSTKKKERNQIAEQLLEGSLKILIGTHALIEDQVVFQNLGLAIIDEQHRFGVAQRAKLWKKNTKPPHILVMSATPIPRTLAMTIYGDLDVSVIDELPPGRKAIQTTHMFDSQRLKMHGFIRKQIAEGRQIYFVYPLISESEAMDYKDLEDGYNSLSVDFPSPEYSISVVHGKMKPKDKEIAMSYFVKGISQILVATTVIEVGVNVPNASVMIIENAERFGLSQLHQLRGRVGRGANQSYCILMTPFQLSKEAKKRLQTMVSTNDGFEIAEADLQLRGPGDLEGTQQSGMPMDLKIANLAKDGQLIQLSRNLANEILAEDPELEKFDHILLKKQLQKMRINKPYWGEIS